MTSTDRDTEALSALMDGEAQELELRRLLDAVERDPELRSRWARQQRVSAAMQGQRIADSGIDVSRGVREALEAKPRINRNPLWSMAVAASVTLAVVMGGQQLMLPDTSVQPLAAVSELSGAVVPVLGAQPVQASLGARSLPVGNRQTMPTPNASEDIAEVYERLARDRYSQLNARHATVAAQSHPAPYISYVRIPEPQPEK